MKYTCMYRIIHKILNFSFAGIRLRPSNFYSHSHDETPLVPAAQLCRSVVVREK